ncbi:uncharacterized protein LOC128556872 [Mercenaria mercenaria]|uniref:uncharacterized protein LOC128556872 n=1 Tax=Mercenaria mercenaria TaxID=6596 RepID=UPI00234F8DB9|nr:uncharacterized protein LOC128556872 [Mercenaria mercenaria]XP_053398674.1 uncharacterized protein LOC128556872 [Mercenaria mercenaria]
MPPLRQPKYCHLITVFRHCGLKITKELFLKNVQDITPVGHDPFPWTVDDFLFQNKREIIKHRKDLKQILFPAFGKRTNLGDWDISTFCFLLIKICKLEGNSRQGIQNLRNVRNRLIHFGEGDIDDQLYKRFIGMIEEIIDRCSEEIGNPALTKELRAVLNETEAVETAEIEEEEKKLREWYTDEHKYGLEYAITMRGVDELTTALQNFQVRFQENERSMQIPISFGIVIRFTGMSKAAEEALSDAQQRIESGTVPTTNCFSRTFNICIERIREDVRQKGLEFESHTAESIIGPIIQRRLQDIRTEIEDIAGDMVEMHTYIPPDISQEIMSELDSSSWRSCIEQKNKTRASELLKSGILPRSKETIDEICSVFQDERDFILQLCNDICKEIVKASDGVTHVWAAYTLENKTNITFVIHTDINPRIKLYGAYRYIHRVNYTFSSEGNDVLSDPKYLETKLTNEERETICRWIKGNRKELMKNHKYLSIIAASPVRSRKYKPSSCPNLIQKACICLYVPVKGYIPIDELPFKASYNNIETDVREGIFTPYMHSQEDKEECLRFGCQIENSPSSDTPQSGALCGFIEHPRYGICGITSAHVLLDPKTFEKLKNEKEVIWPLSPDNESHGHVYWHCGQTQIGDIVRALYCKGDELDEDGYEVALFKITNGRPKTGQFHGDECDSYNSGLTYNYLWMANSPFVFKFGWKTKKTKAKFADDGICISVKTANVVLGKKLGFELHGQLMVNSEAFADKGDSGAPVFTKRHDGEIVCVGLVTGGTSYGATVVTPIEPILKALKVSGLKNFEQSKLEDKLDRIEGSLETLNTKLNKLLKRE